MKLYVEYVGFVVMMVIGVLIAVAMPWHIWLTDCAGLMLVSIGAVIVYEGFRALCCFANQKEKEAQSSSKAVQESPQRALKQ